MSKAAGRSETLAKGLDSDPAARAELLAQQMATAGLELWQAPEGFWAIRVKPTEMATKPARARRARRVV